MGPTIVLRERERTFVNSALYSATVVVSPGLALKRKRVVIGE